MGFEDRFGRSEQVAGGGGIVQVGFDQDFTTFDAAFPNAEMGPATGLTLEQFKAGISEDGSGSMRIQTADMVAAGADPDFSGRIYLTEAARYFASMQFIMEMLGFDLPGVQALLGIDHMEAGVSTTPADSLISSPTDGLVAAGLFGDHTGTGSRVNKSVFWTHKDPVTYANFSNNFLLGLVSVEPFGLGSRLGYAQASTIAAIDGGTSWTQVQLQDRASRLSDTHELRPVLVINRDPDWTDNDDLKINRLQLYYSPR